MFASSYVWIKAEKSKDFRSLWSWTVWRRVRYEGFGEMEFFRIFRRKIIDGVDLYLIFFWIFSFTRSTYPYFCHFFQFPVSRDSFILIFDIFQNFPLKSHHIPFIFYRIWCILLVIFTFRIVLATSTWCTSNGIVINPLITCSFTWHST